MSLDGFVRSAGAAMGSARESFGNGGVALAPPPGVGPAPTGFGDGSGRAAEGFAQESGAVFGDVAALGEHDRAGEQQLWDALAAAGVGRTRMDAVIAAAVADVAAMGVSTNTPAGQRALVAAIRRHLEDTKATVDGAADDASTRAASANVTAAGYDGIGQRPGGAGSAMSPMSMMAPMMGTPMSGGLPGSGGLPMGGLPLGPLTGLLSGFHPSTARSDIAAVPAAGGGFSGDVSPQAAIPVSDVRYDRHGLAGGPEAYRGYIARTLDVMGITDPAARANWTRGLEVGLKRESGFNPGAIGRIANDPNNSGPVICDGGRANASRGGLQTIPGTFAAHHQPGTSTNIYDPVANIAAAMNYVMRRYHVQRDGSNLSSVGQFNPNHPSGGY